MANQGTNMYLYVQTTSGEIESSTYIVLDSTASSKSNSSYLINRNKNYHLV